MKLGKAFSDSLILEEKTGRRKVKEPKLSWWIGTGRALVFTTVYFVGFFLLLWRLFDLTAIRGRTFRSLADSNRTRELTSHAPRGILFDRTGRSLVTNTPQYRLHKPCAPDEPCTQYISRQEGDQLIKEGLPDGWFLEKDFLRTYPFGADLSHLVGYLGELTSEEFEDDYYALRNYRIGDRVGRMGVEAVFEERLRGKDGKELVEVDAMGKIIRTLGAQESLPGEDIALSVDSSLSSVVASSFPLGERGAVVVSKPATGEILALYSSPSFSPLILSPEILNDPEKPLFNRAIGGVYPPGSTFKIVTALAALEEGAISAQTTVEDTGVITIGPFSFPNWYFLQYGRKEGIVDIVGAIKRSNDIFFYKTGEWLGITKLSTWARVLGVGRPLGIELAGEASGLMPDPTWKNLRFGTKEDLVARNNEWYLGDTYHVAIGQGYLLTTPLQVNAWTNVVANKGKLCQPTIKKNQEHCKDLKISQESIELVTKGMEEACATGGTGWPLFDFMVPLACKTGTAEFGPSTDSGQAKTHAWFTAFAPVDNPEISVTVLVEGAGEGSSVAAPVAKKILEEWFGR